MAGEQKLLTIGPEKIFFKSLLRVSFADVEHSVLAIRTNDSYYR
jgi:hypothetical protein